MGRFKPKGPPNIYQMMGVTKEELERIDREIEAQVDAEWEAMEKLLSRVERKRRYMRDLMRRLRRGKKC